jgi:hypothetical protein
MIRESPLYGRPLPLPARLQPTNAMFSMARACSSAIHGSPLRPVGGDEVDVCVVGKLPELVGEAQVVAHEQRDPQPFDIDRDELIAGIEMLGLAAVREWVDLAVAVLCAIGCCKHERVVRPLIVGWSIARDLGARPTDPHVVQRACSEELRRRAAFGFAEVVAIRGEAGENVSLSSISASAAADARRSMAR